MTIRKMYSDKSLQTIYVAAFSQELDDRGFATFQHDHLCSVFDNIDFDKCAISLIETDGRTQTIEFDSILYGIDAPREEVMKSYEKNMDDDFLSRIVYDNPGRSFVHSDVYEGLFTDYPIFQNHCAKYGIHKVCSIGYNLSTIEEFFIAFDYMGGPDNTGWHGIDLKELEYASYPFALGWLARRKRAGRRQLKMHMTALEGMTIRRLEKLRRFVNRSSVEDLKTQAHSLGLKLSGYDSALYDIRDEIMQRFRDDFKDIDGKTMLRLEILDEYFGYMSIMKNQTLPIKVPEGVTPTPSFFSRIEKDKKST